MHMYHASCGFALNLVSRCSPLWANAVPFCVRSFFPDGMMGDEVISLDIIQVKLLASYPVVS